MSSYLEREDRIIQIRDKLRKDGIKLWLPPYFMELLPREAVLKILAQQYSGQLKIPLEVCYETLKELQNNSLQNLEKKKVFQMSGLASLKIKISRKNSPSLVITKELVLSMRTCDLKSLIIKEVQISVNNFKLISCGKILRDQDSLSSQGVKHGQQILALILSETPDIIEYENQMKELEDIKTDFGLLALDNNYMQLEDQFGNPVQIPPKEKKALTVAMSLHEKGKSALKRNDYSRALIFLLEADEEFRQCNSGLLRTVDNYALLDLDIVWCYLCMESLVHLPEASDRLRRCEQKFHETYGSNLERLIAVKGTPGNEKTLFVKLHLMQAIVLYHQNKRPEALTLLRKTKNEMKLLEVDEQSLTVLTQLGYSIAEATLGLRATDGDLNKAANYLTDRREKRRGHERAILESEKKKLGVCKDGKQYVDPNFLKLLVKMGYCKEAARVALKNTNNIITDSIKYIQENPLPGSSRTKSTDDLAAKWLEDAGFNVRMAKLSLQKHSGDIMKAAEELIDNNGIVSGDLSSIVGLIINENLEKVRFQNEQKDMAFERLREDIEPVDDDHLDIDLLQVERFLEQYLSLLQE